MRFSIFFLVLYFVAGCGSDTTASTATPGTDTATTASTSASLGRYSASFTYAAETGDGTTAPKTGSIPAPILLPPAVELPPSARHIRMVTEQYPIPDGLRESTLMVHYRTPDGTPHVGAVDFTVPHSGQIDSSGADLRMFTVPLAWEANVDAHAVSVFEMGSNEAYTTVQVSAPPDAMPMAELDAAEAAQAGRGKLRLAVAWEGGTEHTLFAMWRGRNGDWVAVPMESDPSAATEDLPSGYTVRRPMPFSEDTPEVYLFTIE